MIEFLQLYMLLKIEHLAKVGRNDSPYFWVQFGIGDLLRNLSVKSNNSKAQSQYPGEKEKMIEI